MENLVTMPFGDIYRGKRVLVTGHTGFKGSWLCEWLVGLGAEVSGYALDPLPGAILFDQLGLSRRMASDLRGDIRDRESVTALIAAVKPEFVFHLAAQPLVRLSYREPAETFDVNVMGTVNVMEGLRRSAHPCVAVMVTTDKCYENREWLHPYREEDRMGGHDPYSASKGAAELVIASWRRSFCAEPSPLLRLASARSGNVIGGGDWAPDRIVPDAIRAVRAGESVRVRNSQATRPWQHVLDPLCGYLRLGAALYESSPESSPSLNALAGAFNFGPEVLSNHTVGVLMDRLLTHTGGSWESAPEPGVLHEAGKLNLAVEKAWHLLGWRPVWNFETAVRATAEWYVGEAAGKDPAALIHQQIADYQTDATNCTVTPKAISHP